MADYTYNWYRTPIGIVTIAGSPAGITKIAFGCVDGPGAEKVARIHTTRVADQLLEYFAGKRTLFTFPQTPAGSEFQRKVWDAVRELPYGTAVTATELAEMMGCPASYKAVGAAIKANPLAICVPTHRIVSATGKPLGANTPEQQRNGWLLTFEQKQTKGEH